jgi:hypothetical protein
MWVSMRSRAEVDVDTTTQRCLAATIVASRADKHWSLPEAKN